MDLSTFPAVLADLVLEGTCGAWCAEHFVVDKAAADWTLVRAAVRGSRHEYVRPGKYVKLSCNGTTVMSDTKMERTTNAAIVAQASGDVLIAGLGLGMILWPILAKPDVKSVTVIERAPEVIELVLPSLAVHPNFDKLHVITADIFEWKRPVGASYDTIYFDIWPYISADNLSGIRKLHRRFRSRLRAGGWMDSWAHTDVMIANREANRRAAHLNRAHQLWARL